MITKFDSLFAGHVDMDHVGYAGTAVNDRRFPNEASRDSLRQGAGHGATYGSFGLRHILDGRTPLSIRRLRVYPERPDAGGPSGTGDATAAVRLRVSILPRWGIRCDWLEDFAVADILTGGRVTFGVGRGYHTREVETFGSPLLDQIRQSRIV